MDRINNVKLKVFFGKVTTNDSEGILEVESFGWPDKFTYSYTGGGIHKMEGNNIIAKANMMAFGSELATLMQKYFSDVPPMTEGITNA